MARPDGYWIELADGVLARRYRELDLTVGLVVGADRAAVVDTRGDRAQGAELAAAIRGVTALPLQIVYTHAHFDHCFGTCSFPTATIHAHPGCAAALRDTAEAQRAEWTGYYRDLGDHATAAELAETPVIPPTSLVSELTLDLGGRTVRLGHPGRAHTDHDLIAHVPDAAVLFAGDLVEQGGPPDFTDGYPLDWPRSLAGLPPAATVVPGHGTPMGPAEAGTQRAELTELARLCRSVLAGELDERRAVRRSPFPAATTRTALRRARTSAPGPGDARPTVG